MSLKYKKQKKLIICADDFGYSPGANQAIAELLQLGAITTTALMVNTPFTADAVFRVKKQRFDLGLHFALEPAQMTQKGEVERQVKLFLEMVGHLPTHISVHCASELMGKLTTKLKMEIYFELREVTRNYQVPMRGSLTDAHFSLVSRYDFEKSYAAALSIVESLENGINELIVHPGKHPDPKLVSTYTSAQRQLDTEVLLSLQVNQVLQSAGIQALSYKDLSNEISQ